LIGLSKSFAHDALKIDDWDKTNFKVETLLESDVVALKKTI
jgi:hypothetical protein